MKIKLIKFDNFKAPTRSHYNDSGADCFAAEECTVKAHSCFAIPLGIGFELPDGYDIVIQSKSGLSKKGIFCANAIVDAGYRGEAHALVMNITDNDYTFSKGEKVGQLVVRPVVYAEFVEELGDERGDAGFGSTGNF